MSAHTAPVLLLNASYAPIASVTLRRAVVLVLQEKAEIVASRDGEAVRSESLSIPLPSVIRLIRYVNVPHFRKAYLTRRAVLQRDNGICAYCGDKATTMDHVIPRSRGGRHCWENIVAACYPCNQSKDNLLLEELQARPDLYGKMWKDKPSFKPYTPTGAKRIVLIVGTVDPAWDEWLEFDLMPAR